MNDDNDQSVSRWIAAMKTGDADAAQHLWARYFEQLVRLVDRKLPGHVRRAFDGEDVALSAFNSLCDGIRAGRFPQLTDRDDLWKILVVIATRKAQNYLRHHTRRKRGGGKLVGESALGPLGNPGDSVAGGLDRLLGDEPTPEFAAQIVEEYDRLLATLPEAELREIAVLKMRGHTVEEIAAATGSTRRTVERRLQIIRRTWEESEIPE